MCDTGISGYADAIMAEIREDMKAPFPWGKQIPRDVASFERAARLLRRERLRARGGPVRWPGVHVQPHAGQPGCGCAYAEAWGAYMELLNVVEAEVSRLWAAGELREVTP